MRDNINHFLLNKMLVIRYRVRKKPNLIRLLISLELTFFKLGILSYGKKHA